MIKRSGGIKRRSKSDKVLVELFKASWPRRRINKTPSKMPSERRKRRNKGEITKLKDTLWELCKQITRKRYIQPDGTWMCYTGNKPILLAKNVHTGHCIPSANCSVELRYDLKNLRPQSYNQNINLSGNSLQFERNLIRDHGQAYMDDLWNRNEATKGKVYPKEWFEAKIQEYSSLLQQLCQQKKQETP